MKKRITALLAVAAMIACLAGCNYVHGIEISIFGNAKVFKAQSMTEEVIANSYGDVNTFYSNVEDSYKDTGYTVERYTETDSAGQVAYGYKALSPSLGSASVAPELEKLMGEDFSITYDNSGFVTRNVSVTIKCSGDPLEGYEQYGITDEFTIKAPGPILSTDGDKVEGEANTVKWDIASLEFGAETEKTCTLIYLNPLVLIIAGAVILIAIVVLIIILSSKAAKKRDEEMNAIATTPMNGFVPMDNQAGFAPVQNDSAQAQAEVQADVAQAQAEVQADVAQAEDSTTQQIF